MPRGARDELRAEGAYALYLEGLSIRAESVVVPDRVVLKRAPPPPAPGNDAADPISDWAAIQKNKDQ